MRASDHVCMVCALLVLTRGKLLRRADGSAYYEQGNTKIICAVYGPREVQYLDILIGLCFSHAPL